MLVRAHCITLLSFLSFSMLIYYHVLVVSPSHFKHNQVHHTKSLGVVTKTVVSYSLEKLIQLHGKEFRCPETVTLPEHTAGYDGSSWISVPESNVFVYKAYQDTRLKPHRYVRAIVMIKGAWNIKLYCHLELYSGDISFVEANLNHMWLSEWHVGDENTLEPVLVSCKLPNTYSSTVRTVALSIKPCKSFSAKLNVHEEITNTTTAKGDNAFRIAVCVKPLHFTEDISWKLIAWIEMNKLLGADRIELYVGDVHPRTWKVLQWYMSRADDTVHVHKYTSLTEFVSGVWQRRRDELISYNDCLYRNIRTYRFILPVDIDEIIVPSRVYTWRQLLSRFFTSESLFLLNEYASFLVRNAYFMDQFTDTKQRSKYSISLLDNVVRSELSPDGESGKSFVSTANSLAVFNHYTLIPLKPGMKNAYFLPETLVQMNHYKNSCSTLLPECMKYLSSPVRILDTTIFRYKKILKKNIFTVINLINL